MNMRHFFLWLALLLLVGYLLTGVTQVRPGERAVVRRFGRVLDERPRPGLWIGLPWGMDRLDRVPITMVRKVEVGYQPEAEGEGTPPGQLLTGDHNLVNVRVVIDYAVNEDEVVDYVLHADRTDSLVARAAEAALAEWVGGQTVDSVLLTRKADLLKMVRQRTQDTVRDYHLGITIGDAAVVHLLPPDEVKPYFDEVTRAQAEIRTRENDARQEASRRLRNAQAEKFKTEQLTAAYVRERLRLAEAEGSRFEQRLNEYNRQRQTHPSYLTGIWWEEMSALFAKLKGEGRVDLLDNHLAGDGLDITVMPPMPNKK
jgi:membrane protease subunit HflK